MPEARRFLRYVTPGLDFLIEIALYMWIASLFLCDQNQYKLYELFNKLGENISFIFIIFFASGGIGHLLSVIYHSLYWRCQNNSFEKDKKCKYKFCVDHRPTIINLIKTKSLSLKYFNNAENSDLIEWDRDKINNMKRSEAWAITVALWHGSLKSSSKIGGANNRIDSIADLYHSLGTTICGSVISFIIFFPVFLIYLIGIILFGILLLK